MVVVDRLRHVRGRRATVYFLGTMSRVSPAKQTLSTMSIIGFLPVGFNQTLPFVRRIRIRGPSQGWEEGRGVGGVLALAGFGGYNARVNYTVLFFCVGVADGAAKKPAGRCASTG